jgi:hypothetical protein
VRPTIRNISAAGGAATLLLLNGHNMVGVGILQTAPDINIIPAGMLERVDVVADGGSALYGSDAIAGTINMITRKHMNGLEVDAHYGLANNYYKQDFNVTMARTGVRARRSSPMRTATTRTCWGVIAAITAPISRPLAAPTTASPIATPAMWWPTASITPCPIWWRARRTNATPTFTPTCSPTKRRTRSSDR